MHSSASPAPIHGPFTSPFALFEDTLGEPARARVLEGFRECIEIRAAQEVDNAFARIAAAQARGAWIALAIRYELGYLLEPRLNALLPAGNDWLLRAWVFDDAHIHEGAALDAWWHSQLAALDAQQRDAGLLSLVPAWSEAAHRERAERALAYIEAGDCYQVNLTFPCHGVAFGHPLALFARLRERQPVRHGAVLGDGEEWLLSCSPELFVERRGNTLTCRPMKGTAPRDADPVRDAALGQALVQSDKNRAENLMIVDLIRNDLGRLAPAGGVHVERMFELESYPSLHQLTSTISASPVHAGLRDVLQALFPCGSITGAPKVRAMEIIGELEAQPRNAYCGALGWLAPDGDFSLNVAIRTLQLGADGNFRLDVGSGIVADSQAAAEYAECLNKARFAHSLVDELRLIETILWRADGSMPLLPRHLARLARSASELRWHFDETQARAAIATASVALPATPHRLRLLLGPDGNATVQASPLDPLPADIVVGISRLRLDPADPRLRHKTTARSFYDAALREAIARERFDLLFFNTRGELCEGARANIFLELEGALWTPPIECGLLPGVAREEVLEKAQAGERVLFEDDLHRATRVLLSNALRGLVEVRLAHQ